MDDQRWGFEEADDWEYQELDGRAASKAAPESEETLVGLDPDGVVEVVVSPAAEVIAVRLSPEWRRSVDPRGLHSCAVRNTISTEQNTIAQKVHDLGTEWAKSNTGAMQEKSDSHVMT